MLYRSSRSEPITKRYGYNWAPATNVPGTFLPHEDLHPVTLDDARRRLFELIDSTPQLDWLLLTKRPENIRGMWPDWSGHGCVTGDCPHESQDDCDATPKGYRHNALIGTSISDQPTAERNVLELLHCRDLAPVLFVSAEPLLAHVDMLTIWTEVGSAKGGVLCHSLDWVIIGGESGPHARPCQIEWIRSLIRQCDAAAVSCFVKQLGAEPRPGPAPSDNVVRFAKDAKGSDPHEWPTDLIVREFPRQHGESN